MAFREGGDQVQRESPFFLIPQKMPKPFRWHSSRLNRVVDLNRMSHFELIQEIRAERRDYLLLERDFGRLLQEL